MKLVQFGFAYDGPFGQGMAEAMDGLARAIADEPGLIWKIWTENKTERAAGGIFTDEQSAQGYSVEHTARLEAFGIGNVNARVFDVNGPLSAITTGPV